MKREIHTQHDLIIFLEYLKESNVELPENLTLQFCSNSLGVDIIQSMFIDRGSKIITGANVSLNKFHYMGVKCSIDNDIY